MENTSKYDISDSKKDTYHGGSTAANFDAVSQRLFQKKLHHEFLWILANFCRIHIKNNAWWIAKKILSKKVKQIQQRWGWRDRNCNGTAKETKVNHYENYVVYISTIFWVSFVLMMFPWTGVSSCVYCVLERSLDIR